MLEAIVKIRASMENLSRVAATWLRRKQAECPRLLWRTDEQLALAYNMWSAGAFRAPAPTRGPRQTPARAASGTTPRRAPA